jgi:hypothetical protein
MLSGDWSHLEVKAFGGRAGVGSQTTSCELALLASVYWRCWNRRVR